MISHVAIGLSRQEKDINRKPSKLPDPTATNGEYSRQVYSININTLYRINIFLQYLLYRDGNYKLRTKF